MEQANHWEVEMTGGEQQSWESTIRRLEAGPPNKLRKGDLSVPGKTGADSGSRTNGCRTRHSHTRALQRVGLVCSRKKAGAKHERGTMAWVMARKGG